jgi:hypothetical protein
VVERRPFFFLSVFLRIDLQLKALPLSLPSKMKLAAVLFSLASLAASVSAWVPLLSPPSSLVYRH